MSIPTLANGMVTATQLWLLKKRNVSSLVLLNFNFHLLYICLEIRNCMHHGRIGLNWLGWNEETCVYIVSRLLDY